MTAPSALTSHLEAIRAIRPGPVVAVSFSFLVLVIACALFGDLLAPRDPSAQDRTAILAGPSSEYLLGTDQLGRDILSRVIDGTTNAVVGPTIVTLAAVLISSPIATVAGYLGGRIDGAVMRVADLIYALPVLLVAIVIVGVTGGGYALAVAILVVFNQPGDIRIIRGAVLAQRGLPYVEAARTLDLPWWHIAFRHVYPVVWPVVLVTAFLDFAFALVVLSSLSFLGIGAGPGSTDWGRMLAENRDYVFDSPLNSLLPGLLIVCTAAAVTVFGDWLSERASRRRGQR
jgi:peptide/nickel transport system permease protein